MPPAAFLPHRHSYYVMPSRSDEEIARLLYAVVKQMKPRNINWTLVAQDPVLAEPIKTGQAARMRFYRFRESVEGQKPRRRNRSDSGKPRTISPKRSTMPDSPARPESAALLAPTLSGSVNSMPDDRTSLVVVPITESITNDAFPSLSPACHGSSSTWQAVASDPVDRDLHCNDCAQDSATLDVLDDDFGLFFYEDPPVKETQTFPLTGVIPSASDKHEPPHGTWFLPDT